ncbi:hypothetical protein LCGC14_2243760 [marine sediment metagenome]|uniref:RNase H type-1 domain-containing protein n=1 Tax=marine sediment metagenome TaxID=412755 RepID=A0A0F9D4U4_9ZZZZ
MIRFLEPFKPETDIFILTGGNKIPIKTLSYEISESCLGRVLIEPEHTTGSNLVREGTERFFLWADGACSGNPGPGGWAYFISAFLIENGKYNDKSSGYREGPTTNNAMELEAVIQGLNAAYLMTGKRGDRHKHAHFITITSDSEYVVKGITEARVAKTNLPIWNRLKAVLADMSEWEIEWVRSSPSNTCHQWCDGAAKAAAKNKGDIGVLKDAVAQDLTLV